MGGGKKMKFERKKGTKWQGKNTKNRGTRLARSSFNFVIAGRFSSHCNTQLGQKRIRFLSWRDSPQCVIFLYSPSPLPPSPVSTQLLPLSLVNRRLSGCMPGPCQNCGCGRQKQLQDVQVVFSAESFSFIPVKMKGLCRSSAFVSLPRKIKSTWGRLDSNLTQVGLDKVKNRWP